MHIINTLASYTHVVRCARLRWDFCSTELFILILKQSIAPKKKKKHKSIEKNSTTKYNRYGFVWFLLLVAVVMKIETQGRDFECLITSGSCWYYAFKLVLSFTYNLIAKIFIIQSEFYKTRKQTTNDLKKIKFLFFPLAFLKKKRKRK